MLNLWVEYGRSHDRCQTTKREADTRRVEELVAKLVTTPIALVWHLVVDRMLVATSIAEARSPPVLVRMRVWHVTRSTTLVAAPAIDVTGRVTVTRTHVTEVATAVMVARTLVMSMCRLVWHMTSDRTRRRSPAR
jgi:hypothetical protein